MKFLLFIFPLKVWISLSISPIVSEWCSSEIVWYIPWYFKNAWDSSDLKLVIVQNNDFWNAMLPEITQLSQALGKPLFMWIHCQGYFGYSHGCNLIREVLFLCSWQPRHEQTFCFISASSLATINKNDVTPWSSQCLDDPHDLLSKVIAVITYE